MAQWKIPARVELTNAWVIVEAETADEAAEKARKDEWDDVTWDQGEVYGIERVGKPRLADE